MNRMFLDDRIAGLYLDITREGRMFATFAGFAVVIGCLGLIGLSAYTAERRTKEIGIRKALGASTIAIVWLLIKEFSKPVLVANVLGWPIAWFFMRDWLDGFAYRIDLGQERFLIAGLGAVVIAVGTTGFHAVQVAGRVPSPLCATNRAVERLRRARFTKRSKTGRSMVKHPANRRSSRSRYPRSDGMRISSTPGCFGNALMRDIKSASSAPKRSPGSATRDRTR